jgi:hypothetical protein
VGWRQKHGLTTETEDDPGFEPLPETVEVDSAESEMKVIAVIQDPEESKKILARLVKVGRASPGF